ALNHSCYSRTTVARALSSTSCGNARIACPHAVFQDRQCGGGAFETTECSIRRLRFHVGRHSWRRNRNGAFTGAESLSRRQSYGWCFSLGHSATSSFGFGRRISQTTSKRCRREEFS